MPVSVSVSVPPASVNAVAALVLPSSITPANEPPLLIVNTAGPVPLPLKLPTSAATFVPLSDAIV